MAKISADQGYVGDLEEDLEAVYGMPLEVVKKTEGKGFQVQPWRWVVERTWAWLENSRGLTRYYERVPENHEEMVYIAIIRLMLRRLTNNRKNEKLERLNTRLQTLSEFGNNDNRDQIEE